MLSLVLLSLSSEGSLCLAYVCGHKNQGLTPGDGVGEGKVAIFPGNFAPSGS